MRRLGLLLGLAVVMVLVLGDMPVGAFSSPLASPILPDAQSRDGFTVAEAVDVRPPRASLTWDSMWMGKYPLWVLPDGTFYVEGWGQ